MRVLNHLSVTSDERRDVELGLDIIYLAFKIPHEDLIAHADQTV